MAPKTLTSARARAAAVGVAGPGGWPGKGQGKQSTAQSGMEAGKDSRTIIVGRFEFDTPKCEVEEALGLMWMGCRTCLQSTNDQHWFCQI